MTGATVVASARAGPAGSAPAPAGNPPALALSARTVCAASPPPFHRRGCGRRRRDQERAQRRRRGHASMPRATHPQTGPPPPSCPLVRRSTVPRGSPQYWRTFATRGIPVGARKKKGILHQRQYPAATASRTGQSRCRRGPVGPADATAAADRRGGTGDSRQLTNGCAQGPAVPRSGRTHPAQRRPRSPRLARRRGWHPPAMHQTPPSRPPPRPLPHRPRYPRRRRAAATRRCRCAAARLPLRRSTVRAVGDGGHLGGRRHARLVGPSPLPRLVPWSHREGRAPAAPAVTGTRALHPRQARGGSTTEAPPPVDPVAPPRPLGTPANDTWRERQGGGGAQPR